jgi:hypothetical protein
MDSRITTIAVLMSIDTLVAIVPLLSYYSPYPNYPILAYN